MLLMEKEIRRIVSIHFKEKYKMDVNPDGMGWIQERFEDETRTQVTGLTIVGGAAIGEDGTNSDTD